MKPINRAIASELNAISLWYTVWAVLSHFGVGWFEERRLVLHPVGHLTVYVGLLWIVAVALSTARLIASGGRAKAARVYLAISLLGLFLLLTS